MKKIWKNLCASAMALTTALGVAGCGPEAKWTSIDLDGDGKISGWETIFEGEKESKRVINNSTEDGVVNVSSLAELKAINENLDKTGIIYRLTDDINCNGEEVSINLHGCILYGNNKNIYNFKLTRITYPEDSEEAKSTDIRYALFHSGVAVYDLHIFMGKQEIDQTTLLKNNFISPLFDIYGIENVKVRGNYTLQRAKQDSMTQDKVNNTLNMSMLALYSEKTDNSTFYVSDVEIIGEINYSEAKDAGADTSYNTTLNIGGVTKTISKNVFTLVNHVVGEDGTETDVDSGFTEKIKSIVRNTNVNLDINITNVSNAKVGLIACENQGFVSNCKTGGAIKETFAGNTSSMVLSGIMAENKNLGEIRYCETSAEISIDNPENSSAKTSANCIVAGIVGVNETGILDYVTSDAKINLQHLNNKKWTVYTGSIMGKSEFGYLTRALAKGTITCADVDNLNVAEVAGRAEYGMIDRVVATTNISINELENTTAVVNFGLLAIFEETSNITGEKYYIDNYLKTPIFTRTIVAGASEVHMVNMSHTNFRYRLGLRNLFRHDAGERELSNNDDPDVVPEHIYEDHTPYNFENNYYSNEEYELTTWTADRDGSERRYELVSNNEMFSSGISSRAKSLYIQPSFARTNMKLKNQFNNPEINWNGDTRLQDLQFTLSSDVWMQGIFNDEHFNGELTKFDYEMQDKCTYIRATDEMLSMIYYTIMNESARMTAKPIIISDNFINSDFDYLYEDTESTSMPDMSASTEKGRINYLFAKNVEYLLKTGLGVNDENMVSYLNRDQKNVYDGELSEEESQVQYIRFTFTDKNFTYKLTFNVLSMQEDLDGVPAGQDYVVYMDFTKTSN